MLFELTNKQRACFGLPPVEDHWRVIMPKRGPYDHDDVYLYLDGTTVVKCITVGETYYSEEGMCERLSDDDAFLLPKTARGKPVSLSISTIKKRKGIGMCLSYYEKHIGLYSCDTQINYFSNVYTDERVADIQGFAKWVENWCAQTTQADLLDVAEFVKRQRQHVRFREGDVFRFKIDRRLYGYGRLLLDYSKMRKEKQPFWDIFMGKPLVCSVYHIATERRDVTVDELKDLASLPSCFIMDNNLFYGEYEIIGNIPVTEHEDYPIMYGCSISVQDSRTLACLQWGKLYRTMELSEPAKRTFLNNGIGFHLNLTRDVLLRCIAEKSNDPYWESYYPYQVERDLRNPKHSKTLEQIKHQFGIEP